MSVWSFECVWSSFTHMPYQRGLILTGQVLRNLICSSNDDRLSASSVYHFISPCHFEQIVGCLAAPGSFFARQLDSDGQKYLLILLSQNQLKRSIERSNLQTLYILSLNMSYATLLLPNPLTPLALLPPDIAWQVAVSTYILVGSLSVC